VKLPEMKTGLTISTAAHLALLLWGLISFAARPLEAKPTDSLPVDIISDKDFSELTKGVKNAPKEKPPAPLVEKVDAPKPVEDSSAKLDKKEVKAAKVDAPVPPPQEKPPEPKPEKKPPPPKVDQIAEALKKIDQKPPLPKVDPIAETLKKEEQKKKAEPQKPQPKFDPTQIAALLDKREPQRQAATGEAMVPVPGLGVPTGNAPKLSQSELDALRGRLMQLWNVPAGVQNPDELRVTVVIRIGRDRKLNGPPRVLTSGTSVMFQAARDNAMRAVFMSQPFDMLKPEHYDLWKEIEITFDPRYMNGGG
jgi:outer membrane biosynthesis protein TonB